MEGKTLRQHGLRIGHLEAGAANAITDVAGVRVGHVTVSRDEPPIPEGRGISRTGATAIVPGSGSTFRFPVPAGATALNGAGELTGFLQISEWGLIETPIYLTSTMAVGRIFDGAVAGGRAAHPRGGLAPGRHNHGGGGGPTAG
ncbi:MAG: P1 family peptidase, partial [Thermoleophilia bacterium]|nr:P1 family peptidase [Thermoleophilia bacterium]